MNSKQILEQANSAIGKAVESARMKRNEEDRKYILAALGKDLIYLLEPFLHQIAENSQITREEFKKILSEIKIEAPNVNVSSPSVEVKSPVIPPMSFPEKAMIKAIRQAFAGIVLKAPNVTVNPPVVNVAPAKVPTPKVTVKMPATKRSDEPTRMVLVDPKTGEEYKASAGLISSGGGGPAGVVTTRPLQEVPVGFEQLAVGAAAGGLASIPATANKAVMTVEDSTLRYRSDGNNPDATTGLRVFIGGTIILNSRQAITNFRAIRVAAPNSELNVAYYETK